MSRRVGRYLVGGDFARGGMASVHLGRLLADRGFSRLVAIKMLSPGRESRYYAQALEEEAKIASRIRHPNVVQPLDVVVDGNDILVVLDYVHGVSLATLLAEAGEPLPEAVVVAIMVDVLKGLHAAHEATDERGRPLGVVHRDVSPQNVLVGVDGVARLADFGIAKVMRREEQTATGIVKGKVSYMSPEQLRGLPLTRQADVFAAGAVIAQALTAIGPTKADDHPSTWLDHARNRIANAELREIVTAATASNPSSRQASAAELATALASAVTPAFADVVGDKVTMLAGAEIEVRAELVRKLEADPVPSAEASGEVPAAVTFPTTRKAPLRSFLAGGAAALVLVAILAIALRRGGSDAPPGFPAPPPIQATQPPPPAPEPPPAPTSSIVEIPPDAPPAFPAPSPKNPAAHPSAKRARARGPDCEPPFRIAPDGTKHYKPECLE